MKLNSSILSATCVVLLVGGTGTRLRTVVSSTPKPMAPLGDRSFLELLIQQVRAQGARELVMCTGYLAEQIEDRFGDGSQWGLEIRYSRETSPLGTAGAIKLAQKLIPQTSDFIVMNGDSFLEMDLGNLLDFHRTNAAIATLAVRRVEDAARYGTVHVDASGRVNSFVEKTGLREPGLINGGVYAFKPTVFEHIPEGWTNLESQVFPQLLKEGVYAREEKGIFIDIGTPEDYGRAQELCESLYRAAT